MSRITGRLGIRIWARSRFSTEELLDDFQRPIELDFRGKALRESFFASGDLIGLPMKAAHLLSCSRRRSYLCILDMHAPKMREDLLVSEILCSLPIRHGPLEGLQSLHVLHYAAFPPWR